MSNSVGLLSTLVALSIIIGSGCKSAETNTPPSTPVKAETKNPTPDVPAPMKFESEAAQKYAGLNGTEFPTVFGIWPGLTQYQLEATLGKADPDSNDINLIWSSKRIICYMDNDGKCGIVTVSMPSTKTNIPDVGTAVAEVKRIMGTPEKEDTKLDVLKYANGVDFMYDRETGRVTQLSLINPSKE